MAKKAASTPSQDGSSDRSRKRQLSVVSRAGVRRRFLRGMITHDLVQRGLDFDSAYAVARAIRDQLSDRDEVSTAEIHDLITEQLEGLFGADLPPHLTAPVEPTTDLRVIHQEHLHPFSRGLLARSIYAAGVDLDRAYWLVTELEKELRAAKAMVSSSSDIARRTGDLLERFEGLEVARRYRMVRRIRRLPRPLVVFIGGASGTGKSTLALELAPLLKIYRVNATDTIRQVMRMVFSPAILPALHRSSFEVASAASDEHHPLREDSDAAHRLIASFEEQALRIAVGLRAVVERAVAENLSILMEGVHIVPPLMPFADLEGAVYQVPLMLGTEDEEVHRSRFVARARLGGRRAERYLEHFASIRVLHDFLLQQAETHDIPLLDTSSNDPPVADALRLVSGMLQKSFPALGVAKGVEAEPMAPTLLLVIDGLADRPARALGWRTPLQAASTPTLDRLALEGQCGLADPVAAGVVADTAAGGLALFGQSPLAMKRGAVEALGAGVDLSPRDIALRGNFATLDESGRVIDRRAGRIRRAVPELAEAVDHLQLPDSLAEEVEIRVKPSTEHRVAIVLRGEGLSSAIVGSDPGEGAAPGPPLTPRPQDPDNERAVYTARALSLFEQEARRVLASHPINARRVAEGLPPANTILTRGPGRLHRLIPLEQAGLPLRLSCISGDRTILGLAAWLGAETITSEKMTANLDTDLAAKIDSALEALGRSDLVVLHVKGADIAAHDQRPDLKATFLEKTDSALGRLLELWDGPLRIAVASDHATLSESGQHAADPIPVLIWGQGIEADKVQRFDEMAAAGGALQRFSLQLLLGRLFDLS